MVSTTYVQFIKGFLLLLAALGLTIGVLVVAGKDPLSFIGSILESKNVVLPGGKIVTGETFLSPGLKYKNPLDFASLAMGLILGTAALPHILIRYYTVPTPGDARKSTVVAIGAIGVFYVLTLFLGLGANYFKTYDPTNQNLSAPLLANFIGGEIFFAFISSIAFATILGTVAGLIMAAAGAIAHDIYTEYLGKAQSDAATLKMSKMTAVGVGILAILLGIVAKGQNVAFLVGLAFAIAASANLPALLCTIYWKGAKEKGIVAGIWTGLLSSILLILLSPTVMGASAIFPLENPGLVSIPLGLAATVLLSLGSKK
jgi:cation/acetate symporter